MNMYKTFNKLKNKNLIELGSGQNVLAIISFSIILKKIC